MPIEFEFDGDEQLLITRYRGIVDDDQLISTYRSVYALPDTRPGFRELALHADDFQPEVTATGMSDYMRLSSSFHSGARARTAAVVGKLSHELMLDRVASSIAASGDASEVVELFSTARDAVVSLGVQLSDERQHQLREFDFSYQLSNHELRQKLAQAEAERDEARAFYQGMFETSSPTAIWDVEAGHLISCNAAFCSTLGYSNAELSRMRISDLDANESPEQSDAHVTSLIAKGHESFETALQTRMGTLIPMLVDAWHVRVNDRSYLQAVFFDISQRRQQQEELNNLHRQIEAALSATGSGTWRFDAATGRLMLDATAQDMTGLPAITTVEDWLSVIHPGDRAGILRRYDEAQAHRATSIDLSYRLLKKLTARFVRERGVMQYDRNGSLLSCHGLIQYVNEEERKREKQALSQRRYRRLIENLGHQFGVFSRSLHSGEILYASTGFGRILGLPAVACRGRNLVDLVPWRPGPAGTRVKRLPDRLEDPLEHRHEEVCFEHREHGLRVLSLTSHLSTDEEGRQVSEGIIEDITLARSRDQALREQHQQLEQAREALAEQNDLLETIDRLQTLFLGDASDQEVFDRMLQEALRLSQSPFGFVLELCPNDQGEPTLRELAVSRLHSDAGSQPFYEHMLQSGMEHYDFPSLLAPATEAAELVLCNFKAQDKGTPEAAPPAGALQLEALLAVPLLHQGRAIGVIALANRMGGYSMELVEQLEPVWAACAQLVNAHASKRQLEAARQELEQEFSIINRYVMTAAIDCEDRFTEVSDAFCRALGYERSELIGASVDRIRHPDQSVEVEAEAREWMGAGLPWNGEVLKRRKDGTACWLEVFMEPVCSTSRAIEGFTFICTDVTEKKRNAILSTTDPLTQLNNRLKLDAVLEGEVQRTRRYNQPLSLIMVDVDHFKAVNDSHGHQVGDLVLTNLADLLRQHCRETDEPGRWGGEEFLIVCPQTPEEGAVALAEKLRLRLSEHDFPVVHHASASFGVATCQPGESAEGLVSRADAALYRAKAQGRNRVVAAAGMGLSEAAAPV
ncbi:diguanylate cyclase [Synechococcus sp. RSCCF101]|uniref:diguanylate cyclase n=1 Tax=Synechococcus sp. RSCCF101 TaxID=2511069 RepID=UPI0012491723|nr:diguanylate cyclase [Synechococcus sp. RSCCF101]QEY31092.1 diguanylate cyclase [Synechococcus sp. RSCCF101]